MTIAENLRFLEEGKDILKTAVERSEKLYENESDNPDFTHLLACKNAINNINEALRGDEDINKDNIETLTKELVECLQDEAYPFLSAEDYNKRDELFSRMEISDYLEDKER